MLFQDVVNVLVKYCGPKFLAMPMQGSTMLILDFIHAANTIAAVSDLKEVCGHFLNSLRPSHEIIRDGL
jgi:hypothetical protein